MSLEPSPSDLSPLDRQNVVDIERPAPSPARRILVETIETIGLALILFLAINFVSARIRVDGQSMEPTFHNGDYVIVSKLSYQLGEIERGDVVVFPYPLNREEDFIKRVVALPGDSLSVQNGVVYVNGQALDEDYLAEPMRGNEDPLVIPAGHVFVMGDNRNDSDDSRRWGPLAIEDIIGKAVFRYLPFDQIGVVEHYELLPTAP